MANFAIINGSIISSIIVAEDITVAQEAFPLARHIIEVPNDHTSPAIGWLYDEDTKQFTKPETPETV